MGRVLIDKLMKLFGIIRNVFNPDRPPKDIREILRKVEAIAFPRGREQISEEAETLYAVLERRVSIEDLKVIISVTKPMFYVQNKNAAGGKIQRIDNSIFQKRSKIPISNVDIGIIHKFYANYFNLEPEIRKGYSTTSDSPKVIEEVNLFDEDNGFWGKINLKNPDLLKSAKMRIHESKYETLYNMLLISLVIGAHKRLSKDDQNEFCRIAYLPEVSWGESHYSRFAFLMSDWVCDPDEDDLGLKVLKDAKRLYGSYKVTKGDLYKEQSLFPLFKKVFIMSTGDGYEPH